MKKKIQKLGFTLVELLLSMSLVLGIVAFTIPVTKSFLDQNEFDIAFRFITSGMRKAHIYSISGKADSAWGFKVQANTAIVFSGTTYDTRNSSLDEVSRFSNKVSTTGLNEIIFAKSTGIPNTTGNISIANSFRSKSINLNSKGVIIY